MATIRSLFLTHNSIATPLVRSQVLPYLRELRKAGIDSAVLSFEPTDEAAFPDAEFPRARWSRLRRRSGTHLLAKLADLIAGIIAATSLVIREQSTLIHARSYIPAAIAMAVGTITRKPFIFDMRGFLGEEYLESGHWGPRDLRLRVLKTAELVLLRRAAATVVLTHVAAERLVVDPRYASLGIGDRVTVVPCAVDLERFAPLSNRFPVPTVVHAGSLGAWYLLDEMLDVYAQARAQLPNLRFLFLNRDEQSRIHEAILLHGLSDAPIEVRAAPVDEMPALLASCHVGIVLARPQRSVGSSPIKAAEYLACGLPVVVSAPLGDVDVLVERYEAGYVVRGYTPAALASAGVALAALVSDEPRRANARRLAEEYYSLDAAVTTYRDLYMRLTKQYEHRR